MNIEQYRKRFSILMESELGDVKPLISEGVVIVEPDKDEWCKLHVEDTSNQICIVKTPFNSDWQKCKSQVQYIANKDGYINVIEYSVNPQETGGFCKSVWEKIN